jgi:hypothetical protein
MHPCGKLDPVFPVGLGEIHTYRTSAPAAPPSSVAPPKVAAYGMLANDVDGDCVIAMAGHAVMALDAETGSTLPPPTTSQCLTIWRRLNGNTANGLVISSTLSYWRNPGLFEAQERIFGYGPVTLDQTEIKLGVARFGVVLLGIQCPQSAEDQYDANEAWTVVPGSPIIGGHAVLIVGYDPLGVWLVSWGRLIHATWQFVAKYADEAWVVLSPEIVAKGGYDGLNVNQLAADLDNSAAAGTGLPGLVHRIEHDIEGIL